MPGWKQLMKLLPYLSSRTDRVVIGLITLAVMGIVGTLLPLSFGVIMDCLAGNPQPLGRLSQAWPEVVHLLIPAYQPSSSRTVIIYCLVALVIVLLKGVFSFWTRQILIGLSRDIEYDLRNDLLDRLLAMEPEFYVRNRTGELMSRATNDLNAVRMVLGPGIMYSATTLVTMVLALLFMFTLSPSLSLWVLIPVPIVALSVRKFGRVIHALYEQIQASLATLSAKAQENLAGVRVVRAYAQEPAEMRGFDAPNREYVSRNLKLIAAWSMFMPALTGPDRHGLRPGALVRRPPGHPPSNFPRRVRRLLHLHGTTHLPHDRPGLRHQYFPAWRRLHGPPHLHPRSAPLHQ